MTNKPKKIDWVEKYKEKFLYPNLTSMENRGGFEKALVNIKNNQLKKECDKQIKFIKSLLKEK